jgi:hypothetical protein
MPHLPRHSRVHAIALTTLARQRLSLLVQAYNCCPKVLILISNWDIAYSPRALGEAAGSSYDVGMAQRRKFALAIFLLLLCALFPACKRQQKSTTVVVRLLRDLRSVYGSELDRRILEFQGSNPRIKSGQQIIVGSETGDYKDMLQKQSGNSENIDLIILDAPDDASSSPALQIALPQATDVCAGVKACPAVVPAIIPSQIGGDRREAAQAFVNFLQKTPAQ